MQSEGYTHGCIRTHTMASGPSDTQVCQPAKGSVAFPQNSKHSEHLIWAFDEAFKSMWPIYLSVMIQKQINKFTLKLIRRRRHVPCSSRALLGAGETPVLDLNR